MPKKNHSRRSSRYQNGRWVGSKSIFIDQNRQESEEDFEMPKETNIRTSVDFEHLSWKSANNYCRNKKILHFLFNLRDFKDCWNISPELYKVNDYASDVIFLKLCGSNTIEKLFELIETGGEGTLNVAFMAMSLYFLRIFLCAFKADDIRSEARETMLWTSLI